MLTRFVRRLGFLVLQQWMPACLAGFLILSASPLWAQTFDPTLTVGAGIQTSYQHTEPNGGTSLDQFALDHLRLYFSGDITKNISAMFNTDYNSSHQQHRSSGRGGGIPHIAQVQRLVRPLPSAERPRKPLRPVLRERVGGIYRWHSGRLSLCLSGPRQWRCVLGRLQSRDGQDESSRPARSTAVPRPGIPASSGPLASRSISGIRRTATT